MALVDSAHVVAAHLGVLGLEAENLWVKALEASSVRPGPDELPYGRTGCDTIIERCG